ncbi:MAG: hypothetical protein SFT93_05895 [Rickettsiaceae bacterium]|nr:hypothetical protein [Rickettsiaceae bacterium]
MNLGKNIKYIIFGIVITLTIPILTAAYYYINFDKNKQEIEKTIEEYISRSVNQSSSIDELSLNIFPLPHLHAKNLNISGGITGNNLKIFLNYFKLFFGEIRPSLVSIKTINIDSGHYAPSISKAKDILNNISKTESFVNHLKISSLYIHKKDEALNELDSRLESPTAKNIEQAKSKQTTANSDSLDKISILVSDVSISKILKDVNAEFSIDGVRYSFGAKYNDKTKSFLSNFEAINDNFELDVVTVYDDERVVSGNFKLSGNSLKHVITDLSSYVDLVALKYISSNEPFKIKGNISQDKRYLIFDNIELNSKNLSATATLWTPITDETNIISIDIAHMNLPGLLDKPDDKTYANNKFLFFTDNVIQVQLKGDNITLFRDKISSLNLEGIGNSKLFHVDNCSADLGSNGYFKVSGNLETSKTRPKFIGDIIFSHNDINKIINLEYTNDLSENKESSIHLTGSINATPRDIMISNFRSIVSGENISGNLNLKALGTEKLLIGDLYLEDVNFDETNFKPLKNLYSYLKSLTLNMSDDSYNSKFLPLRNYPLRTYVTVNIDKLAVNSSKLDGFYASIFFNMGALEIDHFLVRSGTSKVTGRAVLLATSVKPAITLNIESGNLELNLSDEKIDRALTYLNENFSSSNFEINTKGLIDLKINSLDLRNVYWSADNKSETFSIKDTGFEFIDAKATVTGNFALTPVKTYLAFSLEDINIESFRKYFGITTPLSKGFASIAGQMSLFGTTAKNIKKNLDVTGSFLGKKFTIQDIGINELITKINYNDTKENTTNLLASYASKGTTVIDDIKGSYEFTLDKIKLTDVYIIDDEFNGTLTGTILPLLGKLSLKSDLNFYLQTAERKLANKPFSLNILLEGDYTNPQKIIRFNKDQK